MTTRTHPDYPSRLNIDNDNYYKYLPFYESKDLEKNKGIWADDPNISREELLKRKIWENNQLITLSEANISFDKHNKPLTPILTGIKGRGVLGKYGPNHAADPVITRINPNNPDDIQFVSAFRNDVQEWCIPGGMVDEGEDVSQTIQREFKEEVAQNNTNVLVDEIFKEGTVLYTGPTYGDPRTTDNAWIETYVKHFHISIELSQKLNLTPQLSENSKVKWISCDIENLYGDHKKFVSLAKANALKIIKQQGEVENLYYYQLLILLIFILTSFVHFYYLQYIYKITNSIDKRIQIVEAELNYIIQYGCIKYNTAQCFDIKQEH